MEEHAVITETGGLLFFIGLIIAIGCFWLGMQEGKCEDCPYKENTK